MCRQVVLVGGSTRIPKVQRMLQDFFDGKELCKSVNPDEAVAYGAAVMAAKVSGNTDKSVQDVVLHDVTPLSLGVQVKGGVFSVIIPHNTSLPTGNTKRYTTIYGNQFTIRFKVYQGERSKSTYNHLLGDFSIYGIPRAPKGVPSIIVSFEIDADGILKATAGIVSTGKFKKLTITNANGRLSKEEIEKMVEDAEKYKLEDQEFKKKADAYNVLEDCLYKVKNKIKDYNIKKTVSPEILKEMENAIAKMTKWLKNNKAAPIAELQIMKVHLEFVCKPLF
ncbi:hypothetical protein L1987_12936 [Smallanthus sonchifolius]|uniref:Uncharacterized protein n=1 Tax=Smallanthus sonchifolius TaxID=185202 RepID=A0ACB9JFJ0_9ASTR|nr:hypothetical protein L1987_12936 [Smallanthus sonchifolius]